jgi:hypothetical protein
MASALSAGQQLSALIAGTSIEQLRAQWSLTAARALVRNAPPESKLRTDPHAIDRVPEGGKLRAEDFLVLMATATNAPRGDLEMAWAAGAVDLFRQMDLRGEGELDWNDFAAFVLGLDMPKREREEVEDADEPGREPEEEQGAEAEVIGAPRLRQYHMIPDAAVNEDFANGLVSLTYLPPPIHRVLALPQGDRRRGTRAPTRKAPRSVVFHSFRLISGRAIISRSGLDAWTLFPERARAEEPR